jgi:hypothetical protein
MSVNSYIGIIVTGRPLPEDPTSIPLDLETISIVYDGINGVQV